MPFGKLRAGLVGAALALVAMTGSSWGDWASGLGSIATGVSALLTARLAWQPFAGDYGASGLATSFHGSLTGGTNVVTLTAAGDFSAGQQQGVLVDGAGLAVSVPQPAATASWVGGATDTTCQYKLASLDGAGGVGAPVTSNSVACATNRDAADYVALALTPGAGAVGTAVWLSTGGGAYVYIRSIYFAQTAYRDTGFVSPTRPWWISAIPAAKNDWCVRKIITATILTLALDANCPTTVVNAIVRHDDFIAFNAGIAALSAAGGGALQVPAGDFYGAGSIAWGTAQNVELRCAGRASTFWPEGASDLFSLDGGNAAPVKYGNGVRNCNVSGNHQALGKAVNANYQTRFRLTDDVFTNTCDGFRSDNFGETVMAHLRMSHPTCPKINYYAWVSDATGSSGIVDAEDLNLAGEAATDLTTDDVGFLIDGNTDTVICRNCDATHVAGNSLQVSNAVGNARAPGFVWFSDFGAEYPTGHNYYIVAGYKIKLENASAHAAGNANFIDCQTSSNLYYSSSTGAPGLVMTGVIFTGASGSNMYLGGNQASIVGGQLGSDDALSSGGTPGTCPNIEIAGSHIHVSDLLVGTTNHPTIAEEGIKIDASATDFVVNDNDVTNAVTQHVVNLAGRAAGVVSCNRGDVNDCSDALGQTGIPFVAAGGSVTNTGSAVAASATVNTLPGGAHTGWYWLPAHAVDGATLPAAAGWYWGVGIDATHATIYSNTLAIGADPKAPTPLTTWATVAAGAYVLPTATNINAYAATLPAGQLLAYDGVQTTFDVNMTNNANVKTIACQVGGAAVGSFAFASIASAGKQVCGMKNRGSSGSQIGGAQGTSASALPTTSVDTTAAVKAMLVMNFANAADVLVIEAATVKLLPGTD